jgi:hypothetical protein
MFLRRCLWLLALCLPTAGVEATPTILCGHQILHRQQERNAQFPMPKPLTRQQLLRSRQATTFSIAGTPTAPKFGDKAKFWGLDFTEYDGSDRSVKHYRFMATLKLVTPNAYLYVEDGVSTSSRSLNQLSQTFEDRILPTEHKYFGQPWTPGIDGDPRVTLLVMDIRSPGGASDPLGLSGITIGGFFNDEDEYPNDSKHPNSNEREMVVLNANLDVGSQLVLEVLAHEYQHLIHWYHDRSEELWVNEGLSMVAPSVVGFSAGMTSALGTSVMSYGLDYDNSLTQWGDRGQDGIGGDYGAVGLFFTYLGEKYGGPATFGKIVDRREHGIEGVLEGMKDAGYPVQFAELFSQWAVANLADDTRIGDPPHYYGYQSPDLRKLRGSIKALHELLPDLIPSLFQPVARVKAYPAKGEANLRPQAAHYIELTGTGTLTISFDGGGRPFEAFILAQNADDTYQPPFPIPLDPQSRMGSWRVPGLGQSVSHVYLIVTNVAEEPGQAADYRYQVSIE